MILVTNCIANDMRSNSKIESDNLESKQIILQDSNKIKFLYNFDFNFFADNLEESYPYWQTRTLLAASLFPEIGISFYGQSLHVGGYFITNMGERIPKNGGISLYYNASYKNFKGYFGIFPRKYLAGEYPNLYYKKDFYMFNPIINGMGFQYVSKHNNFTGEFVFDWYGGNLKKRIDEFLAQGFIKKGFLENTLFVGSSFLLYHTKNDEMLNIDLNNIDVWLLDRLYYGVFLGTNLKDKYMPYMDKMQISLSMLGSVERKRKYSTGLDPFSNNMGAQIDIFAQFKGFGIENSIYYGDRHYKYFNEYGENLYWGLPFYRANFYDRAEIYWEYKNEYLTGRFSVILHFMGNDFAHQQMLTISLDTQKLLKKYNI